MALMFVIAVVLIIALVGSLPKWPHSKNWGYYPGGGIGLVILIILILLILRHTHTYGR
jgi:Protein of unknown function (DUF3309)